MYCPSCGNTVADGTKFCPICGKPLNNTGNSEFTNNANRAFGGIEQELGNEFNNIRNSFGMGGGAPRGPRLQTDRSLIMYIILTFITCGIYGFWFIYTMAQDVNTACEGDGDSTTGLVLYIILCYITCGLYGFYWQYKLGNRLQNNAYRYGLSFSESGTTILMWNIFGSLLCGLGPLIALNILIKNTNAICMAYNQVNGYGA